MNDRPREGTSPTVPEDDFLDFVLDNLTTDCHDCTRRLPLNAERPFLPNWRLELVDGDRHYVPRCDECYAAAVLEAVEPPAPRSRS